MRRMFAAVVPPQPVLAELDRFLDPRRDAAEGGPWRFGPPANWHVTLAFFGAVDDLHLDRLTDALADVAARTEPLRLALDGAGCFGNPGATKHLYQAISGDLASLDALALRVRNAGQHAGCNPDGKDFRPHLTVARTGRAADATKWLRVLDTFASDPFCVQDFTLFTSHLGEGPNGSPRYEPWQQFALAG